MTSASTGIIQLRDALKNLQIKWEEGCSFWNDDVRKQFQEEVLDPLAAQVRTTLQAMEHLSLLLVQAGQDCQR
jgi:hypothetical protein